MMTFNKIKNLFRRKEKTLDNMLDGFERDLIEYLTSDPTRVEVEKFVRRYCTSDENINGKITDRAKFTILLNKICREYVEKYGLPPHKK